VRPNSLGVFPDINRSEFNLLNANSATIGNDPKTDREAAMCRFMMTVMALAAFGAMVVTAQAEPQPASTSNALLHLRSLAHRSAFALAAIAPSTLYDPRTVSQTSRAP
jgi:hypothetical protein